MLLARLPDLTLEYVQVCVAQDQTHDFRLGSQPYQQRVYPGQEEMDSCTCPGFSYHRRCKHLTEARTLVCDWSSQYSDEIQTHQQEVNMKCPRCGGDTRIQGVGI